MLRIRLRGPTGQQSCSLAATSTVDDLQREIIARFSITNFDVKYGYPPRALDLHSFEPSTGLSQLGIELDKEQLLVINKDSTIPTHPIESSSTSQKPPTELGQSNASKRHAPIGTQNAAAQDSPEVPVPLYNATMVLRIMPDDNSCLFRAFNTAYFGSMDNMTELRSIIAQTIQNQPESYSEAVLDKKPDTYCAWIQSENAWGGAIELNILSQHFDIEICSIDVQSLRVDKYNEGRPQRCIVVYSGIHYDTIALSPSDPPHEHSHTPPDFDTKVFSSFEPAILDAAISLCGVLKANHYYTDTANFSVKCNICKKSFRGEAGARQHAQSTGHTEFGEA